MLTLGMIPDLTRGPSIPVFSHEGGAETSHRTPAAIFENGSAICCFDHIYLTPKKNLVLRTFSEVNVAWAVIGKKCPEIN